jgi:hypothetical protein
MHFTTTTEIARKWSKVFSTYDEAIVLNNNKNIWLLLGWELAQAVLDSWVITQIREELWELNDKQTNDLVVWYKNWEKSDSIDLEEFKKKYNV